MDERERERGKDRIYGIRHVQMRKKRNVSSVMGWLLRRQLSDPGAGAGGAAWAGSIGVWSVGWSRVGGECLGELHVATFLSGNTRRVGHRRLGERGAVELAPSPHVIPRASVLSRGMRYVKRLSCDVQVLYSFNCLFEISFSAVRGVFFVCVAF